MKVHDTIIEGFIHKDYNSEIDLQDVKGKWSGNSLGDKLEEFFKSLKFPSWNDISLSDWTKGEYYYIDSVFVRFYLSKNKTTWEEIEKEHIEQIAGSMRVEQNYSGYSEYTITDSWHDIFVGPHDLGNIIGKEEGKYLLLKISVKTNEIDQFNS